jgi:hypothetical protein
MSSCSAARVGFRNLYQPCISSLRRSGCSSESIRARRTVTHIHATAALVPLQPQSSFAPLPCLPQRRSRQSRWARRTEHRHRDPRRPGRRRGELFTTVVRSALIARALRRNRIGRVPVESGWSGPGTGAGTRVCRQCTSWQSTCLYDYHDNEASKCVCEIRMSPMWVSLRCAWRNLPEQGRGNATVQVVVQLLEFGSRRPARATPAVAR